MGKTLKREKRRAEAAAAAGRPLKKGASAPAAAAANAATGAAAAAARLPFLISEALAAKDWDAALRHLSAMRASGRSPKLGSVQRWVRDADGSGSEAVAARLIAAVLRAADPKGPAPPPFGAPRGPCLCGEGGDAPGKAVPVRRFPPWRPPAPAAAAAASWAEGAAAAGDADAGAPPASPPSPPAFREIQRAPGAGGSDNFAAGAPVRIFSYPPGAAVRWDPSHPPASRADVPCVPGAFVIVGALSPEECRQVLAAGRALGFNRGVDYSFGGGGGGGGGAATRGGGSDGGTAASAARAVAARAAGLPPVEGRPAEGSVWMVDDSVLGPLAARVAHLLPQSLGGGALAGINPRFRLYRYRPGAVFRPHVDGAWPGSGLDARGRYLFDAHGDRWSRLTFLVYLNGGGGEGGEAEEEAEERRQGEEAEGGEGGGGGGGVDGTPAAGGGEGGGGREHDGEAAVDEELDGDGLPRFTGGATTFFCPRPGVPGCLDAHGVAPRAGNVLVFVHGDTAGALVHEGSAVLRGSKYVVRTEVLYHRPQQQQQQQQRQQQQQGPGGGPGGAAAAGVL